MMYVDVQVMALLLGDGGVRDRLGGFGQPGAALLGGEAGFRHPSLAFFPLPFLHPCLLPPLLFAPFAVCLLLSPFAPLPFAPFKLHSHAPFKLSFPRPEMRHEMP